MTRPVAQPRSSSARAGHILLAAGLLSSLAATSAPAADAESVAKAKEVLAKHAEAVVRVTATIKQDMAGFGIQFGGMGGEQTGSAIGTVVDPSGIVVLVMSELKPLMGSVTMVVDGEEKKIEPKTEISKPVIHLADGTEVPARIAIEDSDTGLMYVVPEKKAAKPFAAVPPDPGKEPGMLDELILVARLEKQFGNEPTVTLARIMSVVTKPQRGYVVGGGTSGAAFDRDGRFVGLTAVQWAGPRAFTALPLVVPAADIAEVVAQVREQGAEPATK